MHEVKLWSKDKAVDLAMKHFGLAAERVELSGSVDLVARLQAARRRGK